MSTCSPTARDDRRLTESRPAAGTARRGQKKGQLTWGEIVLKVVLGILLILFLFAAILSRDWLLNRGGGHRIDARWRRYRDTRRARRRT